MSTSIGNTFPGEVDSLLAALKGGLTNIPPAQAVQVVDEWHTRLSGAGSPELSSIASDLGTLKAGLQSGDLSSAGTLLSGLGDKVSALGANDPTGKISQLGTALDAAASQTTSGTSDPSI